MVIVGRYRSFVQGYHSCPDSLVVDNMKRNEPKNGYSIGIGWMTLTFLSLPVPSEGNMNSAGTFRANKFTARIRR
jgi:hypothetical protein